MVQYLSPGIYTNEVDISDFTPSIESATIGVLGFTGFGPSGATLITSQNQLIDTYGNPSEELTGQGLEAALEILEATNRLYFVRANSSNALDASALVAVGGCPAVGIKHAGTITAGAAADSSVGYGVDTAIYLKIQAYDNAGNEAFAGGPRSFAIPAGTMDSSLSGTSQAAAMKKIVGGDLDADKVGIFWPDADGAVSGHLVGWAAGSGAMMTVSAYSDSSYTTALSALQPLTPSGTNPAYNPSGAFSEVKVFGSQYESAWKTAGIPSASGINYLIESMDPGHGFNGGTDAFGNASGFSVSVEPLGGANTLITFNKEGIGRETFKTNFLASGAFIEDVINTGETNPTSQYFKGNLRQGSTDLTATKLHNFGSPFFAGIGSADIAREGPDSTDPKGGKLSFNSPLTLTQPKLNISEGKLTAYPSTTAITTANDCIYAKLVQGTISFASGTAGSMATADLVGRADQSPKTGVYAFDDESLGIDVALVPGIYNQDVQNALINLAQTTQNFIALVSPPYGIGTTQDAIAWTNGRSATTANQRTSPINSSYAAVYFPHVQVYSVFDQKNRWYDPTIFAARTIAHNDTVGETWFAPAGFTRGKLAKPTDVEVKLNQGDRDSLYSGGNIINPVVNFVQQGITIFGQRTSARENKATNRINIRRLIIALRRAILASAARYAFEPNDSFTWEQVEGLINPFLDGVRRRRGITEFRVICDETTNTPARVDRNELWCKVIMKPTKTAEMIVFEVNLTNQSAQLGNL